jgi:hypothetical protein
MLSQQQRHQYLETLGISSWLPRTDLKGAAPSQDWVHTFIYSDIADDEHSNERYKPEPVSALTNNTNKKPTQSSQAHQDNAAQARALAATFEQSTSKSNNSAQVSPSTINQQPTQLSENNQLSELLLTAQLAVNGSIDSSTVKVHKPVTDSLSKSQTTERTNNKVEPIHTPATVTSSKAAPVMRLMFWQYAEVLVVDSLPAQLRGTLSSVKYEQLLTNLIKAMGCDANRISTNHQGEIVSAQGSAPYTLNWPTLAGESIDQGWEQAVSAVQHKLAKTLQSYSPKVVLMLGEASGQMLMNLEDDFDAIRGVTFSIRQDIKAVTTFSLTQMLNVPGCKRDVWFDIQSVLEHKNQSKPAL